MLKIGAAYLVIKPLRIYYGEPDPIGGFNLIEKEIVMFLKRGVASQTHQYFFFHKNKVIYTYFYGEEHQYLNFLC